MSAKTTARGPSSARDTTGHLECGAKAPDFVLVDDREERLSMADLEGKWVVLYFYPKDNTPGCTREAQAFQAAGPSFKRAGAVVIGVSRDSTGSHTRFKEKLGLSFPLLSDPDAEVHKAYGAYGKKTMYGKTITGALRTTVIIDPEGRVARVFPNVKVDGHAEAVLSAIKEAKAARA